MAATPANQIPPGGAPARRYLNERVVPVLMEGLKMLAREQPADPLLVLARFLEAKARAGPAPHNGDGNGNGGDHDHDKASDKGSDKTDRPTGDSKDEGEDAKMDDSHEA